MRDLFSQCTYMSVTLRSTSVNLRSRARMLASFSVIRTASDDSCGEGLGTRLHVHSTYRNSCLTCTNSQGYRMCLCAGDETKR